MRALMEGMILLTELLSDPEQFPSEPNRKRLLAETMFQFVSRLWIKDPVFAQRCFDEQSQEYDAINALMPDSDIRQYMGNMISHLPGAARHIAHLDGIPYEE